MHGLWFTVIVFLLGLAARSNSLALAAGLLLALKVLRTKSLFPLLEEKGVEVGLIFLMLAVLTPIALNRVGAKEVFATFTSWPGAVAIAGGLIATVLNGMGLTLLEKQPQIIIGLVIGSIIGIVFFKGVPVGHLMAGGIAAFIHFIIKLFQS